MTPLVELVVVNVYVPMQALFGTENGPKVALADAPAGTGTVNPLTKVSDFGAQEVPIGPLKTTLTVNGCKLFVQLVIEGVMVKFWPRTKVVGLMVFAAYRHETL